MYWKGALNILGGFLIHLTLGTFFTLGNMTPYLISYLKIRNPSITFSMSIWFNALSYVGQGSFMALGGLLEKKIGARFTCLFGCSLFCISIAVTSLTIKFGFIATVLTYGLLSCTGLGIGYIAPLSVGMRWFPKNKGLVNGIVLSGYGLGALVFNQVQTALLNPNNSPPNSEGYYTDETVLESVPKTLWMLGIVYGSIQALAILMLFPSPDEKIDKNSSETTTISTIVNLAKKTYGKDAIPMPENCTKSSFNLIQTDLTPKQVLKRKEFYMFWCTFALHAQCVQFINTYYKTYGAQFISDDRFLTIVGSVGSVCNCVGRIIWGQAQDKTSYRLIMAIISITLTFLLFTFTLVGEKVMFAIWVSAAYFAFAGIFPLFAAAGALAFGPKFAGTNFGLLFTAPAFSSVAGAIVIQMLLTHYGWTVTFSTIGSLTFIASVITFFVPAQLETIH